MFVYLNIAIIYKLFEKTKYLNVKIRKKLFILIFEICSV